MATDHGQRTTDDGPRDIFVDSHCHLDDARFDADRGEVIARARDAGLRYLLAIGGGAGPDDLAGSVPLAEQYDGIFAAAGIHPHEAVRANERHYDLLQTTLRHPKILALGEIGLDYYYDHSPPDAQRRVLIRQLGIAREAKRPVVIHCRDAWPDLTEIIATHWAPEGLGGILHCFSGTREDAFRFLDWGFFISFAGNITFKKADELRAVARAVPAERLLVETDSPYLAPVPYRGKRNEPAHVVEVTRALADLRASSLETMGRQIISNFERFFALA
jgi:TatD DNase family protein